MTITFSAVRMDLFFFPCAAIVECHAAITTYCEDFKVDSPAKRVFMCKMRQQDRPPQQYATITCIKYGRIKCMLCYYTTTTTVAKWLCRRAIFRI